MLGFQNKGGPQQSQRPTAALVIRPALAAPGGATVRPEGPQRLHRPAGALVSAQLWQLLEGPRRAQKARSGSAALPVPWYLSSSGGPSEGSRCAP